MLVTDVGGGERVLREAFREKCRRVKAKQLKAHGEGYVGAGFGSRVPTFEVGLLTKMVDLISARSKRRG